MGFDTVNDDNFYLQPSNPGFSKIPPAQWVSEENPHFCYYAYYFWANLYSLNHIRKMRGLNTFTFRPHISDSGSPEHITGAYLLAHGISRGAILKKAPLLQYLFYLKQIGISMSPLSDNKFYIKESRLLILFPLGSFWSIKITLSQTFSLEVSMLVCRQIILYFLIWLLNHFWKNILLQDRYFTRLF